MVDHHLGADDLNLVGPNARGRDDRNLGDLSLVGLNSVDHHDYVMAGHRLGADDSNLGGPNARGRDDRNLADLNSVDRKSIGLNLDDHHGFGSDEHHPAVDGLNLAYRRDYAKACHHLGEDDLHRYHPFEDQMSAAR
jgi:hypothetical protein